MNLQPTRIQRETVERWLPENLLSIVKDFEDWHIIATDIPEGLARSNATVVKEIQILRIESMQLLSLSQSVLQIVVETVVGLSIYVNANDYKKVKKFVIGLVTTTKNFKAAILISMQTSH